MHFRWIGKHSERWICLCDGIAGKALCDLAANSSGVNLRYPKEAALYLEDDIRMELSDFKKINSAILEEYAKVGKKTNSIRTLLKLLKQ